MPDTPRENAMEPNIFGSPGKFDNETAIEICKCIITIRDVIRKKREAYSHCIGGILLRMADVRRQSVRAHSKDWRCHARVTPAGSRRLHSTLAAAPLLFAHAVVKVAENRTSATPYVVCFSSVEGGPQAIPVRFTGNNNRRAIHAGCFKAHAHRMYSVFSLYTFVRMRALKRLACLSFWRARMPRPSRARHSRRLRATLASTPPPLCARFCSIPYEHTYGISSTSCDKYVLIQ